MCVLCAFFSTPPLCARAHKGDLFFRCTKRTRHIVNMNNLQYLRTNYLRNIVILQRNQYVSRISSDWELCGMCVFTLISSFVLKNSKPETIAAQGIQGFENVRFKNFQSEGKRTKRTFENCTKIMELLDFCSKERESLGARRPRGWEGDKIPKFNSAPTTREALRCAIAGASSVPPSGQDLVQSGLHSFNQPVFGCVLGLYQSHVPFVYCSVDNQVVYGHRVWLTLSC